MKKRLFRPLSTRFTALTLCTAIIMSVAALAASSEKSTFEINGEHYAMQTGTVSFRPLLGEDGIGTFYYSDGFFCTTPEEYSPQLATLSAAMSASAARIKSEQVESILDGLGFEDIHVNTSFKDGVTSADSIGCVMAHKALCGPDGENTDRELLIVVIRGGGYTEEWGSNFYLGESGDAAGFSAAAAQVFDELQNYISVICASGRVLAAQGTGNLCYYVCGHSRGGSVANLLSKRIIDRERIVRSAAPNSVFSYPLAVYFSGTSNEEYPSIHNIINPQDAVTFAAPTAYGFHRYGVDHEISVSADNPAFLYRLRCFAPDEAFPSDFSVAYLKPGVSVLSLAQVLKSDNPQSPFNDYSQDEQISMSEFLSDAVSQIFGHWNPDRSVGYVNRTFGDNPMRLETAVCNALHIFNQMSREDFEHLALCLSSMENLFSSVSFLNKYSVKLTKLTNHIPEWYRRSNSDRAEDIDFLWLVLNKCSKDGYSLEKIFGSSYETIEEGFPVVMDYFLENLSLDYQKQYDAEQLHVTPRTMYIFATIANNFLSDRGSLIYQHTLGVYWAALQSEDSLYPKVPICVNDAAIDWVDSIPRCVFAEYDADGKMLSASVATGKQAMYSFSAESGSTWKLFVLDTDHLPQAESYASHDFSAAS